MRSQGQIGKSVVGHANTFSRSTDWLDKHELSVRQRMFVLFYLETCNATIAAKKAGYANPKSQGSRMLTNVSVQAALKEGRGKIESAIMVTSENVARMWWTLATCDMNELIQNIHGACRYCHGLDHDFQWKTPREFNDARMTAIFETWTNDDLRDAAVTGDISDPRIPTNAGGYGYRNSADPHPSCPECDGLGVDHVRYADTRNLSPAARLLYDGVEETKQGKKIRTTSREAALERLAKHLGMFVGKIESEDANPLTRLVKRLAKNATAVPVRVDPPKHLVPDIADTTAPLTLRGE